MQKNISVEFTDDESYEIIHNCLKKVNGDNFKAVFLLDGKEVNPLKSPFGKLIVGDASDSRDMSALKSKLVVNFGNINANVERISIAKAANVSVQNSEAVMGNHSNLAVDMFGDGGLAISEVQTRELSLKCMGLGGVTLKNINAQACNVQIKDRGGVRFDSSCKTAMINIIIFGSGNVLGGGMSILKGVKRVLGSGQVAEFKGDMSGL
jgi:hypothetical protein